MTTEPYARGGVILGNVQHKDHVPAMLSHPQEINEAMGRNQRSPDAPEVTVIDKRARRAVYAGPVQGGVSLPDDVRNNVGETLDVIDKRAQARRSAIAPDVAQMATNVRNLAGRLWWQLQGHTQRGEHVQASQCHIARGRMLHEAKKQGLAV